MRKSHHLNAEDLSYMKAVEFVIDGEWKIMEPLLIQEYEMKSLMLNSGLAQRPFVFLNQADTKLQSLAKFILQKHSEFLDKKPPNLMLQEWQEMATRQIGMRAAFCAVKLDEIGSLGGTPDPNTLHEWTTAWQERFVPIGEKIKEQLAVETTLKAWRSEEPNKSRWTAIFDQSLANVFGGIALACILYLVAQRSGFLAYLATVLHSLWSRL